MAFQPLTKQSAASSPGGFQPLTTHSIVRATPAPTQQPAQVQPQQNNQSFLQKAEGFFQPLVSNTEKVFQNADTAIHGAIRNVESSPVGQAVGQAVQGAGKVVNAAQNTPFGNAAFGANQQQRKTVQDQYQQAMQDLAGGSVAYAPAKENQQGNVKQLTTQVQQSNTTDPIRRLGADAADVMLSTLQGFTGNVFKNPITNLNPEAHIIRPLMQTAGQVLALDSATGDLTKLAKGVPLIRAIPTDSKLSFIPKLIGNIAGVSIYDQLDPGVRDRIKTLAQSAEAGTLMTSLGGISKLQYSVPLAFTGWFGIAKLNGASNKDAIKSGIIGAALDASGKFGGLFDSQFKNGAKTFTPQEARDYIINSPFAKTPFGENVMKDSFNAESTGQNITINMTAAKQGVGAKIFNMDGSMTGGTPKGFRMSYEVTDSAAQPEKIQNPTAKAQEGEIVDEPVKEETQDTAVQKMQQAEQLAKEGKHEEAADKVLSVYGKQNSTQLQNIANNTGIPLDALKVANSKVDENGKPLQPEPQSNAAQQPIDDNRIHTLAKEIIKPPAEHEYKTPLEKKAFTHALKNAPELAKQYEEKYGNYIASDNILDMVTGNSKDYTGHNEDELRRPSAATRNVIYQHWLETRKGQGNNTVLVVSSGNGSGKSTIINQYKKDDVEDIKAKDYPIILETMLAGNESKIADALKEGYKVEHVFVQRDPHEAWKNGVLPRAKIEGRVVEEGVHVDNHIKEVHAAIATHDKYISEDNYISGVVNNNTRPSSGGTIDDLRNLDYNRAELLERNQHATEESHKRNEITKEQYQAITRKRIDNSHGADNERQQTPSATRKELTDSRITESTDMVREALYSGDIAAAKDIHENLAKDTVGMPSFDVIREEVRKLHEQNTELLNQYKKELIQEGLANNPDDATNQLYKIAQQLSDHFSRPKAIYKLTGTERTYTSADGKTMQAGGNATQAYDRLIYATDIEGFKKNIQILSEKFNHIFTGIYDRIKSGAIDSGDYDNFKSYYTSIQGKRLLTAKAGQNSGVQTSSKPSESTAGGAALPHSVEFKEPNTPEHSNAPTRDVTSTEARSATDEHNGRGNTTSPITDQPTGSGATGNQVDPLEGIEQDIPRSIADAAHQGTSFTPEKRGEQEIHYYTEQLKSDYADLEKYAKTPEQKTQFKTLFAQYRKGYAERVRASLVSKSRTISPMITGAANFPVARNQKMNYYADNKIKEEISYREHMMKKIRNTLDPQMISSDDENVIEKLQEKLNTMKKLHDTMITANKIIRSKKDVEARLKSEAGLSEASIKEVLNPDYTGRTGFASFSLTNNNAKIKAIEERITRLQKIKSAIASETSFAGGMVHMNPEDNRLQIVFDARPDSEMIRKLKGSGFKWSPKNNAWQRQLTSNAKYAAENILNIKINKMKVAPEKEQIIEESMPAIPTSTDLFGNEVQTKAAKPEQEGLGIDDGKLSDTERQRLYDKMRQEKTGQATTTSTPLEEGIEAKQNDEAHGGGLFNKEDTIGEPAGGIQPDKSVTLGSGVNPGLDKLFKEELVPAYEASKEIGNEWNTVINPPKASEQAMKASLIIREALAKIANYQSVIHAKYGKYSKFFSKYSDAQNISNISSYERDGLFAKSPDPSYSQLYHDSMVESYKVIRSAYGKDAEGFIENYVRRAFVFESPDEEAKGKAVLTNFYRSFSANKSPLQRRVLDMPLDEALQNMKERGIKVKMATTNPELLRQWSLINAQRALAYKQVWNDSKASGLIKFVRRGGDIPEGFIKLNDRAAQVFAPAEVHFPQGSEGEFSETGYEQMVPMGNYYADAAVARIFNNAISKGLEGSPTFRGLRFISNQLNSLQLGLSAFHFGTVSIDAGVTDLSVGIGHLLQGHPIKALKHGAIGLVPFGSFAKDMYHGRKLMNDLKNNSPEAYAFLQSTLNPAGGRLAQDERYRNEAYDKMLHALVNGNPIGATIRAGFYLPHALVELAAKPLMEYAIPRVKLGAFMDLAELKLSRLPKDATSDQRRQALVSAWTSIDNRMGQLVYDNLFWHKTGKDIAMLSTRSVGWNLGTIRELGGAVVDATGTIRGKGVTDRMLWAAGLVLYVSFLGAIYQYLHTGTTPQDLKDYLHPKNGLTDKNGNPDRVSLPTYMKDIYAYSQDPLGTVLNKTSPLLSMMSQLIQNKDYYGNLIRNPNDAVGTQLAQAGEYALKNILPFSLQKMQNSFAEGGNPEQAAEAFFGIIKAPQSVIQSDKQKAAIKAYQNQVGLPAPKTPEQQATATLKTKAREEIQKNGWRNSPAFHELMQNGTLKTQRQRLDFIQTAKLTGQERMVQHLPKSMQQQFK